MSLEQILEQTAHARPGYDLVSFKEAGLPVYVSEAADIWFWSARRSAPSKRRC
jgi:hypothetical protein